MRLRSVLAVLLALGHSTGTLAEIEERTFSVFMNAVPIGGEGFRPYSGQFGPIVAAHLTGISVPNAATEDFRVLFVKPGFSTGNCGNAAAVVVVRDGTFMTASQFRELFGRARVPLTNRLNFAACASVTPFRPVDRFHITAHYEKEVDEEEEPPPPPPPFKEETVEGTGNTRFHTLTCQQASSNAGCRTAFACPAGFALMRAGAACDLERGQLQALVLNFERVRVHRPSDKPGDGVCRFGDISIQSGDQDVSSRTLASFPSRSADNLSCREHDENGGDCAIKAVFKCGKVDPQATQLVPFSCARSDSNEGCARTVSCPAGTFVESARASCNLETASGLPLPSFGTLAVVRASDRRFGSRCFVGGNLISQPDGPGTRSLTFSHVPLLDVGCREHDENGGDCNISGEIRCAGLASN